MNTLFNNLFNANEDEKNPQLNLTEAIRWRDRKKAEFDHEQHEDDIRQDNNTVKEKEYAQVDDREDRKEREEDFVIDDEQEMEEEMESEKKGNKRGRPAFLVEGDRTRISLYLPSEIVSLSDELAYRRRTNRNDLIKTILSEYFVEHKDEFDKKMDVYFEDLVK